MRPGPQPEPEPERQKGERTRHCHCHRRCRWPWRQETWVWDFGTFCVFVVYFCWFGYSIFFFIKHKNKSTEIKKEKKWTGRFFHENFSLFPGYCDSGEDCEKETEESWCDHRHYHDSGYERKKLGEISKIYDISEKVVKAMLKKSIKKLWIFWHFITFLVINTRRLRWLWRRRMRMVRTVFIIIDTFFRE